ncbi:hypothetical protein QYF36_022880 [Acer negundo]|nr:hypothetical protein QYF36_022880 [Acer negundo]
MIGKRQAGRIWDRLRGPINSYIEVAVEGVIVGSSKIVNKGETVPIGHARIIHHEVGHQNENFRLAERVVLGSWSAEMEVDGGLQISNNSGSRETTDGLAKCQIGPKVGKWKRWARDGGKNVTGLDEDSKLGKQSRFSSIQDVGRGVKVEGLYSRCNQKLEMICHALWGCSTMKDICKSDKTLSKLYYADGENILDFFSYFNMYCVVKDLVWPKSDCSPRKLFRIWCFGGMVS